MRRATPLFAIALLGACGGEPDPPRHLLLLSVDTLRADHLGAWGHPRPTSPALDAFAADAVLFEDAIAGSSWTLPSLATALTGLPSSTHGCTGYASRLHESFETLPERLRDSGYRTGAVASHVFLDRDHGLPQGIVEFDDELVLAWRDSHEAVTSELVTDRGLAWLQERSLDGRDDAPWFLWLHYFDPHYVYQVHSGVSERFGTETEHERYEGEVAFTDAHLGRLLDGLAALGLADDTLVVLLADHGEEWREHGRLRHGHTLHRELLHVPLAIRDPRRGGARVATPVPLGDVPATALELLGLDTAPFGAGRSLVPLMDAARAGRDAARDHAREPLAEVSLKPDASFDALVTERWKLIAPLGGGAPQLYDRDLDRAERRDVAARRPEVVAELAARLAERLADATAAATAYGASEDLDLDRAQLERLRDLGYVDELPPDEAPPTSAGKD